MTAARRVVIIGAGITGLSAAYFLQQSGAPLNVVVLEKAARVGGRIYTERIGGYVLEHGADVFLARKPQAMRLCEALGLTVQSPIQQGAYLRRGDGLHRLPFGMSGLAPAQWSSILRTDLLSLRGKMRTLAEYLVPRRRADSDESVAHFYIRRFGHEAFHRVIAPLLTGLSGGDPATLSLSAQLPHLRAMEQEYGSVLRAMHRGPRSEGTALRSLPGGLGTLIEALQAHLDRVTIHTDTPVQAISKSKGHYEIRAERGASWDADAVIVTSPAPAAARLMGTLDAKLAKILRSIPYGSTRLVHLAFGASDVPHALDASGYIAAPWASGLAAASTWSSAKLPGRAPPGKVLLRVIFGRTSEDPALGMSDARLVKAARQEVKEVLGVSALPELARVHRWRSSLPQYVLGHGARCARIHDRCTRHPGLFLAGAAYRGAGIPDCIQGAQRVAQSLLSDLGKV